RATAPERANAFLFEPCTARFSFGTTKEKWGVHPAGQAPFGSRNPVAAGRRPFTTPAGPTGQPDNPAIRRSGPPGRPDCQIPAFVCPFQTADTAGLSFRRLRPPALGSPRALCGVPAFSHKIPYDLLDTT